MKQVKSPEVQSPGLNKASRARRQPLYAQVYKAISDSIISGDWVGGNLIPSEEELALQHGVSIGTVRRALAELVTGGFLERRPHHGTFVAEKTPQIGLHMFYDYYRLHTDSDQLVRSHVTDLMLELRDATEREAEFLNLTSKDRQVVCFERLRFINSKPVMTDRAVMPYARIQGFPTNLPLPELIYRYIEENFGLRIVSLRESVSAQPVTQRDCELLRLEPGDAVLVIDIVARDHTHTPFEFRQSRATTEGFRYINEIR